MQANLIKDSREDIDKITAFFEPKGSNFPVIVAAEYQRYYGDYSIYRIILASRDLIKKDSKHPIRLIGIVSNRSLDNNDFLIQKYNVDKYGQINMPTVETTLTSLYYLDRKQEFIPFFSDMGYSFSPYLNMPQLYRFKRRRNQEFRLMNLNHESENFWDDNQNEKKPIYTAEFETVYLRREILKKLQKQIVYQYTEKEKLDKEAEEIEESIKKSKQKLHQVYKKHITNLESNREEIIKFSKNFNEINTYLSELNKE